MNWEAYSQSVSSESSTYTLARLWSSVHVRIRVGKQAPRGMLSPLRFLAGQFRWAIRHQPDMLPAMNDMSQRGAPREAKALRFCFAAEGGVFRAVSVNVSGTGALLKASLVPESGAMVILKEFGNRESAHPTHLSGEVRWRIPKPSLDRPETGFAIEFRQAWVERADEEGLRSFLYALGVMPPIQIHFEDRQSGRVAMFRFEPGADDQAMVPTRPFVRTKGPLTRDPVQNDPKEMEVGPVPPRVLFDSTVADLELHDVSHTSAEETPSFETDNKGSIGAKDP